MRLLFFALCCLLAGGILPILLLRRRALAHLVGQVAGVAGGLAGTAAALTVLLNITEGADLFLAWTTADSNFALHLDPLAAFFLLPLAILVAVTALYAGRYLDPTRGGRRLVSHWFFFHVLAASMILVVTAANGLVFLIAWEGMSLSSFFLVVHEFNDEQARQAGWLYLLATHIGTAFLFAFFLEADRICGSLDFAAFSALATLPQPQTFLFFTLILIGFGAKAGLFPFHVWLPDAHPAAPSHISALMSGVMIKTAIYGLLRMLTFLPPLPPWCGLLVLILGISGALFGIAMAMQQDDIKRSLAYSTVENIGLIFLGLGLWLYGNAIAQPAFATLALTGALLHVWNHALFKGLLFLGAGSMLHATGTRTLSHLGGLLHRMPHTATLFIIAAAAIAALPPLNGFISEWFLYLAVLSFGQAATGGNAVFFLLLAVLLALVGGLVLLVMSRLAGMALLGEPRTPGAARAHESSPLLLLPMAILALLCLGIGLVPAIPLRLLTGPLAVLAGQGGGTAAIPTLPDLPFGPLWSVITMALLLLATAVIVGRYRTNRPRCLIATWGCGFRKPTPRMVYMAGGFSELAVGSLLCLSMQPKVRSTPVAGLFPAKADFYQQSLDPVLNHGFTPLFVRLAERAYLFRKLQAGQLSIYLLYIFVATTLLLGWVMAID